MALDRLRAYLAFVNACIPRLRPLDLQDPLVGLRMVVGLEALVAGIGVHPHGQDVDVTVSHPGDLKRKAQD